MCNQDEKLQHHHMYLLTYVQWNLSIGNTIGPQLAVLYREVSLIQRQISTQFCVVGTAGSVLIREVSFIQCPFQRDSTVFSRDVCTTAFEDQTQEGALQSTLLSQLLHHFHCSICNLSNFGFVLSGQVHTIAVVLFGAIQLRVLTKPTFWQLCNYASSPEHGTIDRKAVTTKRYGSCMIPQVASELHQG